METAIHKQGVEYESEEERRKGLLEAKRRYAYQPYLCNICNVILQRGNKCNHLKSTKHKQKREKMLA